MSATSTFIGQALLIEEDDAYRAVLETCARLAGCDVEAVRSSTDGVARLDSRPFDLVVWGVSPRESEKGRVEVLTALREQGGGLPVVMVDDLFEPAQMSFELGADHVLPKPFVPGALVGSIKSALRKAPSLRPRAVPCCAASSSRWLSGSRGTGRGPAAGSSGPGRPVALPACSRRSSTSASASSAATSHRRSYTRSCSSVRPLSR